MILEICAATLEDVIAARDGGADRIELNMALEVGGLTPTVSLYRQAREIFSGEIVCMVRPRSGDFVYSSGEKEIIIEDARILLSAGCDGIVFGALTESNQVDLEFVQSLKQTCGNAISVFHRAIDLVVDWEEALTKLTRAGVDRILTSGMQPTAAQGIQRLRQFAEFSAGTRLQIVAGSGVSIKNIDEIATATGCQQFHGTFSKKRPGQFQGPVDLGTEKRTQVCLVREAKRRLAELK